MLDTYTIKQLGELRSFCTETIESAEEVQKRADALLLLEYIDEELASREEKKSA